MGGVFLFLHPVPVSAFRLTAKGADDLPQLAQNLKLTRHNQKQHKKRKKSPYRYFVHCARFIAGVLGAAASVAAILEFLK